MVADQAKSSDDKKDKDAKDAKDTKDKGAAKKAAAVSKVILDNKFQIFPDHRLPIYDNGPAEAYVASYKGDQGSQFIALLSSRVHPARYFMKESYERVPSPNIAQLVASGIVKWIDGKEHHALIYRNNLGKPYSEKDSGVALGLNPDTVMSSIITPIAETLANFRDVDFVHGCIRPSNIYKGLTKGDASTVLLGDCLSVPPSYSQPGLFETPERALAQPSGRGLGTSQSDIYAFGVTLACLMRTSDPMHGFSDHDIVKAKLRKGSYSAILGKDRFTGPVLELLRGVLQDDEKLRWTVDDVQAWLEGRRLGPKGGNKKTKAQRDILFVGEKYGSAEVLSVAMPENPTDAVKLIQDNDLMQWIKRSLADEVLVEHMEYMLNSVQQGVDGPGGRERLVSRACMALYPEAPIRYKGVSVMPDGFGMAMNESFAAGKDLTPFSDIINQSIVGSWLEMQRNVNVDISGLANRFDTARGYLRQQNSGYGIERCLYYLYKAAPCQSEKLKNYYVLTPEDLLRAFEDMGDKKNRPVQMFDRHIIAFLAVKDHKVVDPFLMYLNASEPAKRVLGTLGTLAEIQSRETGSSYKKLSAWMAEYLEPVYQRFHDSELRESLKSKIEALKNGGDLTAMADLLTDPEVTKDDKNSFFMAMHEYQSLEKEGLRLEYDLNQGKSIYGRKRGREVSAIVAVCLAVVTILGFLLVGG